MHSVPVTSVLRETVSYLDQSSFIALHRTNRRNSTIEGCMRRRLEEFRNNVQQRRNDPRQPSLDSRIQKREIVLLREDPARPMYGPHLPLRLDTTLIDHRINRSRNPGDHPNPLVHRTYTNMRCEYRDTNRLLSHARTARALIDKIGNIQNYLHNFQYESRNFCQVLAQNIQRLEEIKMNLVRHNEHLRVYEIELDDKILHEVEDYYRQLRLITESGAA